MAFAVNDVEGGRGGPPILDDGDGGVGGVGDGASPAGDKRAAQAAEDEARGRRTRAGNGAVNAGYAGEDEKGRRWDGDWTNIPYPSFEPDNWAEVVNYLCQRILDLTAADNPTLTPTQKALLWTTAHEWKDGQFSRFAAFLNEYQRDGQVSIEDLKRIGDTGLNDQGDLQNGQVMESIKRVAEKIAEIEKQADLPNADMRAGNALLRSIGADRTGMDEESRARLREESARVARDGWIGLLEEALRV
jgi:hypothetical protein